MSNNLDANAMSQSKLTETPITYATKLLNTVFGFAQFRASQQAIIENVLGQKNTLAIMPTGGGKSLCYQIPALVFDGLTVCISPLISLMQDQVRQLVELDIPACMLNSTLSADEYQANVQAISQGGIKLLFLAPETALQMSVLNLLQAANVNCLAIDEAHCISEWGHEFRPEYRQLGQLIERIPQAVIIALTATATPRVREDIKRQLAIADESEFIASFDRPNLFIEVNLKDNPYGQSKAFIDNHKGQSGIIYCLSRASVDELTAKLQADGYSALPYHAGLQSKKRAEYQDQFVRDDVDIIVATIAFGMGINKPDVRYVIHYDLPKNIEGYYQQIGRAGRDGLDADCLLLFSYGDTGKSRYFIDQMVNEQEKRLASMHLNQMLALAETEDCRRIPLLSYFGEPHVPQSCVKCDNCLNENQEKSDLTVPAQKFLSCVHRTGQRFGAGYVVDVLRGSNAEKVLQNQHNLLSTYNIGNEFSKKQWMNLSRQLIQKGLLQQDEQFGGLKLTAQAGDVLKGNAPFYALLQQQNTAASKQSHSRSSMDFNSDLFAILKTQRKHIADQAGVPPYAIFPDKSLQEMAHYLPKSAMSLLKIHGVGQAKLTKYGEQFIKMIADYCALNNLAEVTNSASGVSTSSKTPTTGLSAKSKEIASLFDQGYSVLALAQQNKVKHNTIYGHLHKFVSLGYKLEHPERLIEAMHLAPDLLDKGLATFAELGSERLKPVFDALNEQVSYEQLHLLRVFYLQGLSA
jgi:ATP-dependent DNA helicase RecQ